jgi:hypothetical protein
VLKTDSQLVGFNLNGTHLGVAKLHVTHSKDETRPESGFRILSNLFIFNNLAERAGFEFGQERSFNSIENTAGTIKAMKDDSKQC